jgi:hypothetical protein
MNTFIVIHMFVSVNSVRGRIGSKALRPLTLTGSVSFLQFQNLMGGNFPAKSKTARRFVTLGPRRGGQCVGERPPGGVRGAACAVPTEGAGPGSGRDAPPKTRLDGWQFSAKSKTERRFVTLGPRRGCPTRRGGQCVGHFLLQSIGLRCKTLHFFKPGADRPLDNMTRPDLAFSFSQLNKFLQYPDDAHLAAAYRVLAM